MSSCTPSPDEALHVLAARPGSGARLAGTDRRRQGDSARGADAAGVLHRRRYGPRARGVSARRGCLPRAGPPSAVGAVGEEPGVPGAEQVERVAAIIGADGAIGGFTPLVEWVAPQLQGAKQRDFALTLGPFVTTPDEGFPAGVDWEGLVSHAAENTTLYPGDLIVR